MSRHIHASLLFGCVAAAALLLATVVPLQAQTPEWPQFRGPGGLAVAPDQHVPDEFGPGQNVLWKRETPAGHSSPIVSGDQLVLTGYEGSTLSVLSYRRSDGALLWKRDFEMTGEELFLHRDSTPAAPTPCTDGSLIHAYFGAYGLITLDMQGKLVWEHRFPIEKNSFGTGTSSILHGGTLYLVRDVASLSIVHAFDPATGQERWATARPDASTNYSTPFVWERDGRNELVMAGSAVLKAYDASSGEPVWWVEKQTVFACPSPTASDDVLYFGGWSTPNAPEGERFVEAFDERSDVTPEVFADTTRLVKVLDRNGDGTLQREELPAGRAQDAFAFLDFDRSGTWDPDEIEASRKPAPGRNVLVAVRGGGSGDVTDSHVLWEKTRALPYVASPLLYGGRLYYVKRGGYVSSLDVETGSPLYEAARLGVGGEYYASPVGVGDRVLIGSVRGTMFVLGTGDGLEIVARNEFDEGIFATPAVVENTLYLRTERHLWAITALADATLADGISSRTRGQRRQPRSGGGTPRE